MRRLILLALLLALFAPSKVFAEPLGGSADRRTIQIGRSIGDGKDNRIYSQWQDLLDNRPVESISIRVQKRSGGNDAYINLRFGNGSSFDNTRKVYLTDGAAQTVRWDIDGASSGGQPLILSAFNCEVDVNSAEIEYSMSVKQPDVGEPRQSDSRPAEPIRPKNGDWVRGGDGWGGNDEQNDDVHWDEKPSHPPGGYGGRGDRSVGEKCHKMTSIQQPRIDVSRIQASGNLFSGHFKIEGSIAGLCVEEAGYYEKSRLKKRIDFPLSDEYKRLDFDVQVRTGERGEIRVFTSDGRDQTLEVDDEVRKTLPF